VHLNQNGIFVFLTTYTRFYSRFIIISATYYFPQLFICLQKNTDKNQREMF